MQALRIIARCDIDKPIIDAVKRVYAESAAISLKKAAALVLIRQGDALNVAFVRSLVLHQNNELRKFGRFVRAIKNELAMADRFAAQAFKIDFLMVEHVPFLYLMANSNQVEVVQLVAKKITDSKAHKQHVNMDMRDRLTSILSFAKQSIDARK